MLDTIGHIALIVKDSSRTATLFKDLFDAAIVTRNDVDGHEETYVRLGRTWFVLVQAEVLRPRTGDHIAFSVSKSALLETAERLKRMNVEFFPDRTPRSISSTTTIMCLSWIRRTWTVSWQDDGWKNDPPPRSVPARAKSATDQKERYNRTPSYKEIDSCVLCRV
jgi:hypothetical protein